MRRRTTIPLAAAAVAAASAAPAAAHVQVTPARAAPGDPVVFEVLVPGETDAHTTEVALQIPEDVLPFPGNVVAMVSRRLLRRGRAEARMMDLVRRHPPLPVAQPFGLTVR